MELKPRKPIPASEFPEYTLLCTKAHQGSFRMHIHIRGVQVVTRNAGEITGLYKGVTLICPKCYSTCVMVSPGPAIAAEGDEDWPEWKADLEASMNRVGKFKVVDLDNQDRDPVGSTFVNW